MLVEFRVENFKNIVDSDPLDLEAGDGELLFENFKNIVNSDSMYVTESAQKYLLETNAFHVEHSLKDKYLLKSAVIYGANGSGKSDFIQGFQCMQEFILNSLSFNTEQTFEKLGTLKTNSESKILVPGFSIKLFIDGFFYSYSFCVDNESILFEKFECSKDSNAWFVRYYSENEKDEYRFPMELTGSKKLGEIAALTPPNVLLFPLAAQKIDLFKPVFNWFKKKLVIFNEYSLLSSRFSVHMMEKESNRKAIFKFLNYFNINIRGIEVEGNEVKLHHVEVNSESLLNFMNEPEGIGKLLLLAFPVLESLNNGSTLIVDDLEANMHTLIVRSLVGLFHKPEINLGNGQLIFTAQDTSMLDYYNQFRPDQMWFFKRRPDESCCLLNFNDYFSTELKNKEKELKN